jgi:hypothetical protein
VTHGHSDSQYQFAAAVGLPSLPDALQAPGVLGVIGLGFSAILAMPAVFKAATGFLTALERFVRMLRTPREKLGPDVPSSAPATIAPNGVELRPDPLGPQP